MSSLHSLALNGIAITFFLALFSKSMEPADGCRPHCSGGSCVTLHRVKVDFESADEMCRRREGQLLSLSPDDDTLHALDYGGLGDFWIGLRLPDGACSNLSAPLRGYKWTNGRESSEFRVDFWKGGARVCSPRCVSTSSDQKWTERPCSEEIEGFLCRTDHKHACQVQELADVFSSANGCADFPCEHECAEVKGGYRCSCYKGYAPDSKDPRTCKIHCAKEKCPPVCDADDNSVCSCADGFILNEGVCEDIDECEMGECQQKCQNTYGGFRCSCRKGFVLRDQFKCKKSASAHLEVTTPFVPASVKPAYKKRKWKRSSLSTGEFVWLWICLAMLVIVFVCVVRWYVVKRQKRLQQNSIQQTTVTQGFDTRC